MKTIDKHDLKYNYPVPGYIYCVYSPSFPEYIKIGRTGDIARRFSNYLNSTPEADFVLLAVSRPVKDTFKHDSALKSYLGNPKAKREWYDISLKDKAIDYIESILK